MIKLKCSNDKCNYCYEITEAELKDYGQYHKVCLICGSRLEVNNLKELVELDIYKRAEEYLNRWFGELGIEGTLELVEKYKDQATYRIYKEILEKKGLKLKGG